MNRRDFLSRIAGGAAGALLSTACYDTRLPGDALDAHQRAIVLIPEAIEGSLDPRLNSRAWPGKIIQLIFEGLTSVNNERLEARPALADRIEHDARVYDIWLRPDARFHDGQRLTPADVVATLDTVRAPQLHSPLRHTHERIESVEVLGDHRVRITLREAHAPYLSDLSLGVVPAHALGPDGHFKGDPIGAGPYALGAYTPQREVLLRRHDAFFRGPPRLPALIFRTVTEANTRLLALLSGAADLVQNALSPRLAEAMRARPELVVERCPGVAYTYLCPNLRHTALKDRRVRQALLLALDRQALITHKFRGTAQRADSMLPTGHWAATALPPPAVDRAAAERLLDEAGFARDAQGLRFTLQLKVTADKFRRNLARLIAADWAQIGVHVLVRALETGTLLRDVKAGNFDLYLLQWGDPSEPHLYHWIFHSARVPTEAEPNRGGNRGAWQNARADRLIEAGAQATGAERAEIYRDLQRLVAEELPYLSLWHEDVVVLRRRALLGYQPLPNASLYPLWQAYWEA